jgi:hypothetical protein
MAAASEAMAVHGALSIHAGTATSTRGRGETNTFNAISIGPGRVQVTPWTWEADRSAFVAAPSRLFLRDAGCWREA